jgi:hypothetical protein
LHRQVRRLLALEDAVDVTGRAAELVDEIGAVGDQRSSSKRDILYFGEQYPTKTTISLGLI